MNRHFVTSFSNEGYEQYGRKFLEGFIANFPKIEVLHVFFEGRAQPSEQSIAMPVVENIIYHDLMEDTELVEFLERRIKTPFSLVGSGYDPNPNDYRFQVNKWVRKVMAMTSPLGPQAGYRIWIDADVTVDKPIPEGFFDQFCDPEYLAQYIGRPTAWGHSECGFVAYNLDNQTGRNFLRDFREIYAEDLVFNLKEWHDSYVFDGLRKRFEHRGYFKNIADGHDIFHPWPETVLGQYMTHHKGPVAKLGQQAAETMKTIQDNTRNIVESQSAATDVGNVNLMDTLKACKDRYEQLIKVIEVYKPQSIVEVGTWNGERAMLMASEALRHKKECFYIGFDLFDDSPLESKEFNVKPMARLDDVETKLKNFATLNPGFKYQLVKGNTRETLPGYKFGGQIDFAFIDGGHSVETIRSDYGVLKNVAKLIVMDDYYVKGVDTEKWGCNTIIKGEKHAILPMQDNYKNGQSIQMVLLGEAMDKGPIKQKVDLKTRNSASDEEIQSHIRYSASLQRSRLEETLKKVQSTTPVKFIEGACKPHDDTLVLIGASEELMDRDDPDYQETWDELRTLSANPNARLVICKTSYRKCFEESITPWACVLLDPRDHVADKIDPDPGVIYFVSSMCHPSTFDKLSGCRVIGYHAIVGAGETDVIKKEFSKVLCVSGGTTSILRGIALFYHLGFRKAIIYGATSSYKKKPDKPHGRSEKPFVNVDVHGREFLTDPEMIAQSQDAEMAIKLFPDMELDFKGDGMLNHAVGLTRQYDSEHIGDRGMTDIRVGQWVNAFKTGDEEIEAIAIQQAQSAMARREIYLHKTLGSLPDYNSLANWENFGKLTM